MNNLNGIIKSAVKNMPEDLVKGITEEFGGVVGNIAGEILGELKVKSALKTEKTKEMLQEKQEQNQEKVFVQDTNVNNSSRISKPAVQKKDTYSVKELSVEDLRNAVVWSEILGKPVCKKRRTAGRRL